MAFSELELRRIAKTVGELCKKRSPIHLKDKLRLEYAVKGHEVVICERRPKWNNPNEWAESPVAKLKFIQSADKWQLYWQPSDLKRHEYPGTSSSDHITESPILCGRLMPIHWPAFSDKRERLPR